MQNLYSTRTLGQYQVRYLFMSNYITNKILSLYIIPTCIMLALTIVHVLLTHRQSYLHHIHAFMLIGDNTEMHFI